MTATKAARRRALEDMQHAIDAVRERYSEEAIGLLYDRDMAAVEKAYDDTIKELDALDTTHEK